MKSKQVLSIEQMQHLQELGLELNKDTILVWARFMLGKTQISDWEIAYNHSVITENSQIIPAYTLQDVLDALPASIGYRRELYVLKLDMFNKIVCYRDTASDDTLVFVKFMEIPLIEAAYSMLCWAIKNKFVETNKNE